MPSSTADTATQMNWLNKLLGQERSRKPRQSQPAAEPKAERAIAQKPAPVFPIARDLPHLDGDDQRLAQLPSSRQEVLIKIGQRVREDSIGLPGMSSTSMQAVNLIQSDQVDLNEVVKLVEQDPVISGEILKTANSAMLAARGEVDSVQAAAVRLGIRRLRDVILAVAMRSSIFREPELVRHAKEIWRQAVSVASICRTIAPSVGIDAESGYSLGLMADIGRIPLLSRAAKELTGDEEEDHAFLSKLFFLYHERVGASMGRAWHLPEELISVAARHHRFRDNAEAPREAALVSLAHGLDTCLANGNRSRFLEMIESDELVFLEEDPDTRRAHLTSALETYIELHPDTVPLPDEPDMEDGATVAA